MDGWDVVKIAVPILATILMAVISTLMAKADKAREEQIKSMREQFDLQLKAIHAEQEKMRDSVLLLFKKHDEDAKALLDLQLSIAKEHYLKHELDGRFLSLETTFKDGMRVLSEDIKALNSTMLAHLEKDWKSAQT